MNCRYCGASNPDQEHRCIRCGRRLGTYTLPQAQTSALPAPMPEVPPAPNPSNRSATAPRPPHQQTLFRVIPFESIAPVRRKDGPLPKQVTRRLPHADQPSLDFATPAPQPLAPAAATTKPAVQCEASVASLRSRSEAVAIDAFFILLAGGLFLGIFAGWTRQFPLGRTAGLIYAATLALILLFYGLLSCLWSDRSPGVRMAGLHLLHFNGRLAGRRQRLLRLAAGCLSLVPLGFGFFWAFLDEEHLTFHDHISETFTTPDKPAR